MLFRMLVSQFIRQTAGKRIMEEVAKATGAKSTDDEADTEQAGDEPALEDKILPCDVAFVFALGVESAGFADMLKDRVVTRCPAFLEHAGELDGRRIVIAESGIGREKAAKATEDLIAIHRPSWVVSTGFAGGLRDELRRGHIIMADHVTDTEGNELSVGFTIDPAVVKATKGLHVGRLVTVDHIVQTEEEKRELGEKCDAVACDMETLAVAEVCRREKVRFMSVRIISDAVDDHLPPEIGALVQQKSFSGKLGAALGAIFRRPSSVKDMWKLKSAAFKASDRLAKFLAGVVPQLSKGE